MSDVHGYTHSLSGVIDNARVFYLWLSMGSVTDTHADISDFYIHVFVYV